jgi:hypothetical protein
MDTCSTLNNRDVNMSGSDRVEQLPIRQQRGCGLGYAYVMIVFVYECLSLII